MTVLIKGFGVAGYRSFGNELQRLGPFGKLNIIIGQNNSGKSNILRLIKDRYLMLNRLDPGGWHLNDHEYHEGGNRKFIFAPAMDLLNNSATQAVNTKAPHEFLKIEQALKNGLFPSHNGLIFVPYGNTGNELKVQTDYIKRLEPTSRTSAILLNQIHGAMFQTGLGSNLQVGAQNILDKSIRERDKAQFKVHFVPAIREVKTGNFRAGDFSGNGLIERLHQLKNPRRESWSDKQTFEQINKFLRTVLNNPTASLEIPHTKDEVVVDMDGKVLPLESLGTGIHEVVILAAAATLINQEVICLEEPEIHLHPRLQKQLLRYLLQHTTNQYFVTTHSAHLMDTPDAAIFHVSLEGGSSVVEKVATNFGKSFICSDLGYRPSDLLQANCIIWVEGPSDRIYLNHWIKALDQNLTEGQHYAIMFYGGRLLSHLTASDDEVDSFIALQKLNRHGVVVIDSDRPSSGKQINGTKLRVQKEFEQGLGYAWITNGREIENYIDLSDLEEAVKAVHKKAKELRKTGRFEHNLHYTDTQGKLVTTVDKVKVAHQITEKPANLDVLDLKSRMNKLIRFIKDANEIQYDNH